MRAHPARTLAHPLECLPILLERLLCLIPVQRKLDMLAHTCHLSTQEDQKFKAILGNTSSDRLAWAMWDPVSHHHHCTLKSVHTLPF